MNNLKAINGFLLKPNAIVVNAFEELYVALRLKEGRIYSEEEIARLPVVATSHPHYKEWLIRKRSCNKLLRYIQRHGHICNILEVGCGNGWLAAQLSSFTPAKVTGLDINTVELEQARRVFKRVPNLKFAEGDISSGILADEKFDLIVFAASIQYFESLETILKIATRYLTLQGEIHIIDSHLYQPYEIASAKQRSKKYFTTTGFPEMSHLYFHHCIGEIESLHFLILYNPNSWINKLLFRRNPFHWLVVKNHYT
ncbi:MAG: class I SAM-dependent methyltransferase [Ginsengibacter sp.]